VPKIKNWANYHYNYSIRLSTVGRRAFPVTGTCIWNDLPSDITSAPSLHSYADDSQLYVHCQRLCRH